MKKLLFSGLLAFLGFGAFAQTSTGSKALSGSINYTNYSNKSGSSENKNSILTLSPTVGYFIKDGLELGLTTKISFGTTSQNITSGYAIGPYLTKYKPITDKLHFSATGGLGYESSTTKIPDAREKVIYSTSRYYLSASPGLTYFATPRLGFTINIGNIGYSKSVETVDRVDYDSEKVSNEFNFNISPATASVGIGFYFN